MSIVRVLPRVAAVLVALVLLNASVTFYDVWPTPGVEWHGHLSAELAATVLLLAFVAWRRPGRAMPWLIGGVSAIWMTLVVGRYVDVMSPALYGRPINLYWDLRHVAAVAAMMTDAVATPVLVAALAAVLVLLTLVYLATRWAFATVAAGMLAPAVRGGLAVLALAVVVQFAAQTAAGELLPPVAVAPPVTLTYWQQARLLAMQVSRGSTTIAASHPALTTDLGRIRDADVLLVFMEAYGAVTLDRAVVAEPLVASRARFAADVAATGRGVVSAMVDSPTFGGASWLAHVSLMTGVEARDENANAALMSRSRDTIVSTFAHGGYRTVALMPGLSYAWPEGAFYGFDTIYDTAALGYAGPRFGWWPVPNQFAMARLDVLETGRADDRPRFVFFPTTSTHAPFGPIAPYQPDWARLLSADPYAALDVSQALAREPDYLDLAPSYVNAVTYAFATIGGYLAPASRPRPRPGAPRRSPAGRRGHRRGRVVGRAGARRGQPAGGARGAAGARLPNRRHSGAPVHRSDARPAADPARSVRGAAGAGGVECGAGGEPARTGDDPMSVVTIRPATAADFEVWLPLWHGYQTFYKTDIPHPTTLVTWQRLLDPAEPMHVALAVVSGTVVGMVHYIEHRSCWTTGNYMYLQDLFVEPGGARPRARPGPRRTRLCRGCGPRMRPRVVAHARVQHRRDGPLRPDRRQERFRPVPQGPLAPPLAPSPAPPHRMKPWCDRDHSVPSC